MNTAILITIGGLALLDTLSPATMAVTLYLIVTDQKRLTRRLFVYLFTVAAFYFLVGVFLMTGMDLLIDTVSNIFQHKLVSWTVFSIGLLLFIASFYVPEKKKREQPKPKSNSLLAMVALGFTTSLIEVGTAFPYFAAIGIMVTSDLSLFEWPLILAGYNFIMILPPLLIYSFYMVFRRWAVKPLEKLRKRLEGHSSSVLSWVMAIVGLLLIFNSVDYL